ncbi:MAG: hypothetical protein M3460_15885 [Actinomycetota bacterium]|nr:hypothetical protein [Actinomycetota bacterium]
MLVLSWFHQQQTRSRADRLGDPLWAALDEALSIGRARPYNRGLHTVLPVLQLRQLVLEERDASFRIQPQMNRRWGTFHDALDGSVSVFRSDRRLNTDGPAMPVLDMLAQIVTERRPRLVISVGLGGGVRPEHQVGDVVVTSRARFDLSGELDSYEDNDRTFGTDAVVSDDWFADLRFDELREPALLGSSPAFRPPAAGWPQPPAHRPLIRVDREHPVWTRPALDVNAFNPAPARSSPRNPYLGDDAAAVDMDAAAAAKACQDANVPFAAVLGLVVPALEVMEDDWNRSLRDAWAEVFTQEYSTAAATNAAAVVRRICERA